MTQSFLASAKKQKYPFTIQYIHDDMTEWSEYIRVDDEDELEIVAEELEPFTLVGGFKFRFVHDSVIPEYRVGGPDDINDDHETKKVTNGLTHVMKEFGRGSPMQLGPMDLIGAGGQGRSRGVIVDHGPVHEITNPHYKPK